MEKNQNEVIKISKTKLKKLMVASALAGTILTTAVVGTVGMAKTAYQRYNGENYIVSQVAASGILPEGLSSRMYDNGNIYFNYVDANGNAQIAKDSEALVDDIFEDGLSAGFTAEQMEVFFDCRYDWKENYEGVTRDGMNAAKEEAYLQMIKENSKGVSR